MIVDSETGESKRIENMDVHHKHGDWQPGKAPGQEKVDAVIAGGMGRGALGKPGTAGIAIYRGIEGTVSENLKLFKAGILPVFPLDHACAEITAAERSALCRFLIICARNAEKPVKS